MQLRELIADDEAVSPVIGVILMVAITVILAAVIGTFVLGLGDQVRETSPQASFEFDFNNNATGTVDSIVVTHESGESISASQLSLKSNKNFSSEFGQATGNTSSKSFDTFGSLTEVTAGTSVTAYGVNDSSPTDAEKDLGDHKFSVVWESESGSTSATLQKWSGPNA